MVPLTTETDSSPSPWLWVLLLGGVAGAALLIYLALGRRRQQEWHRSLSATVDRVEVIATAIPVTEATSTVPPVGAFNVLTARTSLEEVGRTLDSLQATAPSPDLASSTNQLRADVIGAASAMAGSPGAQQIAEIKGQLTTAVATVRASLAAFAGQPKHAA